MGTHAIVAAKTKKGYSSIYVHYDGYESHMGEALKHFDSQKKVNQLIALGDMSFLGNTLDECEKQSYYFKAFNAPGYEHMQNEIAQNENCFDAIEHKSIIDLHNRAKDQGAYLYIFENGKWMYEDEDGFLTTL